MQEKGRPSPTEVTLDGRARRHEAEIAHLQLAAEDSECVVGDNRPDDVVDRLTLLGDPRREERREEFARRSSENLNVRVDAVASAQECVEGADVVIVITSAREPALLGEWLSPGAHVNAAGGNHWMRREIDEEAVLRSEVIVVDDLAQAKIECGDLLWLEARGTFRWDMAKELQDVVAGRIKGRPSSGSITLFESMGIALEDIAAAQLVYNKAKEQGIGQELPF